VDLAQDRRSRRKHVTGAPWWSAEAASGTSGGQIDMTRRSLTAARVSVSSLALGVAVAAWALASGLLSRL